MKHPKTIQAIFDALMSSPEVNVFARGGKRALDGERGIYALVECVALLISGLPEEIRKDSCDRIAAVLPLMVTEFERLEFPKAEISRKNLC